MGKDASLSPDANKVLKAVEERISVNRQEIEDVTGLSKSKTIQCLSKLVSEKDWQSAVKARGPTIPRLPANPTGKQRS